MAGFTLDAPASPAPSFKLDPPRPPQPAAGFKLDAPPAPGFKLDAAAASTIGGAAVEGAKKSFGSEPLRSDPSDPSLGDLAIKPGDQPGVIKKIANMVARDVEDATGLASRAFQALVGGGAAALRQTLKEAGVSDTTAGQLERDLNIAGIVVPAAVGAHAPELRPAVKTAEGVKLGKLGDNHDTIVKDAPEPARGFVDDKDKFLTRKEAAKAQPASDLDKNGKLYSEELNKAKGLPERAGEGPKIAAPSPEPGVLREGARSVKAFLNPTALGPEAKASEAAIRAHIGEAERDTAQARATLDGFAKQVNALPPAAQGDLIAYVEGRSQGRALADPALQPVADAIRDTYAKRRAKLEALPRADKMGFIADYYMHMWKDPKRAQDFVHQWVSKQGSTKNVKERVLPTVEDGLRAGLQPVYPNPLDNTLAYVRNMDRFIATERIFEELKSQGLITRHPPGEQPPGFVELQGRKARNPMSNMAAYAPEAAARVYNNFISRGVEGTDLKGAYELARKATNTMTMMELGLSTFHAFTMANEALTSGVARGIQQMSRLKPGEVARGVATTLKAPAAPLRMYRAGKKMEEVYLGRTEGGDDMRRIVDHFTRAGSRLAMDRAYRGSALGSYWSAWRRGSLVGELKTAMEQAGQTWKGLPTGAMKAIAEQVSRTMETVAEPLFGTYIPRLKAGAFYEQMHDYLRAHPTASKPEVEAAALKLSDSIDNRFGELVQDNLFWPKWFKQVLQLAVRAPGWDIGELREIGGGVVDLGKTAKEVASGQYKELSTRTSYVLALVAVTATANAVMTALKTGKAPTLQDLKAYPTGGTDAATGKPERAMVPGYGRDVLAVTEDPEGPLAGAGKEVSNKLATAPREASELLRNRDYRNLPIANPTTSATLAEQIEEYLGHVLTDLAPISIKNWWQGAKVGSNLSTVERALSIRPAGRALTSPEGEANRVEKANRTLWKRKRKSDQRIEGQLQP